MFQVRLQPLEAVCRHRYSKRTADASRIGKVHRPAIDQRPWRSCTCAVSSRTSCGGCIVSTSSGTRSTSSGWAVLDHLSLGKQGMETSAPGLFGSRTARDRGSLTPTALSTTFHTVCLSSGRFKCCRFCDSVSLPQRIEFQQAGTQTSDDASGAVWIRARRTTRPAPRNYASKNASKSASTTSAFTVSMPWL